MYGIRRGQYEQTGVKKRRISWNLCAGIRMYTDKNNYKYLTVYSRKSQEKRDRKGPVYNNIRLLKLGDMVWHTGWTHGVFQTP